MALDIATAGLTSAADEGAFMALLGADGKPLMDGDTAIGITLRSRFSQAVVDAQRACSERRLDLQRRSKDITTALFEQETTEVLLAATVSWTFGQLDGHDFPFNAENAATFYTDPRFRAIRERADQFVASTGNFMKR